MPRFIGAEHWACGCEIAESAFLACKTHLIRVADGSFVVHGFAAEKQNNGVGGIDSGVVVNAMRRIDDSVADKDNRPADLN